MTRKLAFEGIDNFRDFGDYPTTDGRRLKAGRLYRSGSHGRATEDDLAVLSRLGLTAVVDLRRTNERERDPSRRFPGFAAQVIENDIGAEEEDPWHAHVTQAQPTAESNRAYLVDYYRRAPLEARHLDLYRRYFEVLAKADGPVLIHCAAGKDRTGLLAALTHHLVGVAPQHIVEDFLLTNDAERIARRMPLVAAYIEEIGGKAPSPEAMKVSMSVEPQYLTAAFDVIAQHRGDIDGYLERDLGVTPKIRRILRAKLLD